MISKASKRKSKRCFVYITLPGQTEAVTAARFEQTKTPQGETIGRLVYGRKYLARPDAVELDPVELKLSNRTYTTALNQGVFGALRDASPDSWGRLVIDRARNATHDEIGYLLNAQDQGASALGFGLNERPPAPNREFNQTIELKQLQDAADKVLHSKAKLTDAIARQVQRLLEKGSSPMGGARPKAVIEDKFGLWIAKFNVRNDSWNYARVEHAILELAKLCGLSVAESKCRRIARRDVLLVKRFDRQKTKKGYLRARMVSGLTLLRADESENDLWSYPALAEEIRRVCANPRKDAVELFRRMCFNALISNTDDHPRNHAIIATDRDWKLSPAYDLTPSVPISEAHRDLAMTVGSFGRYANERNLLSQCGRFLLSRNEAQSIIAEMKQIIESKWYAVARSKKVIERDCEAISRAFVYPGFSYELEAA